ncbi:hypothetical protein ACSQ67_000890 [Phaseolus vulgaris]
MQWRNEVVEGLETMEKRSKGKQWSKGSANERTKENIAEKRESSKEMNAQVSSTDLNRDGVMDDANSFKIQKAFLVYIHTHIYIYSTFIFDFMEEPIVLNKGEEPLDLPPGFRFHPTDEEIITHYLTEKVKNSSFSAIAIGEADLNKCEPWDLPSKLIVLLEGKFASYNLPKAAKDEWVVSRVFHKNTDVKKSSIPGLLRINSIGDDLLDYSSLPPLMDPPYGNTNTTNPLSSTKSQSEGYYLPSFSINNHHQLLIKPEDHHRSYEIPTISYTSNQANLNNNVNPIGNNTLSQPSNMFSDYYVHQNRIRSSIMPSIEGSGFGNNNNITNHDQAILRAFAAKNNEHLGGILEKQCKMEQFSSNHSQETGLSNDRNTETSSVVSKQDNMGRNRALYEDLEGPSSVAPLSDLECLQWDDY